MDNYYCVYSQSELRLSASTAARTATTWTAATASTATTATAATGQYGAKLSWAFGTAPTLGKGQIVFHATRI